jgi:hypothetical protein
MPWTSHTPQSMLKSEQNLPSGEWSCDFEPRGIALREVTLRALRKIWRWRPFAHYDGRQINDVFTQCNLHRSRTCDIAKRFHEASDETECEVLAKAGLARADFVPTL